MLFDFMLLTSKILLCISIAILLLCGNTIHTRSSNQGRFNLEKDLLLVQFDCKTDVDDLHTVAALATLLSNSNFSKIKYHAVAGTYGTQKGLYVPPNDLFQLAFGDNWSDAHNSPKSAIEKVKDIIKTILFNSGDIWIAEAGQSDFSVEIIKTIQVELPELDISHRIHVVQHSDWNEKMTSPESLQYIKQNTDYHKISDGNAIGNGTPGFHSPNFKEWKHKIKNPELLGIWQLAVDIGIQYNGKEGRYNNEAIASGGLDFSDLSEVCWILGIQDIKDTEHFFNLYAN